ncbi:MAG: MFS transporter [Streptosporangiaceae bacterium]
MAGRAESRVINAAGLVQGIVLVTFPAASTILTSKSGYGLSSAQYGYMFGPQVIMAIAASLLGAGAARRITIKRVYLIGLAGSLVSMALLLGSVVLVKSDQGAAYPLLLVATAFLGAGFGLTVPALNTYAAAFHPDAQDTAVLILNALLGLGTVLAPVFVAIFVGLGFWWGLPIVSAVLLIVIIGVSARLPLRAGTSAETAGGTSPAGPPGKPARATSPRLPGRFWLYAAFAALYGICETMNGNWSQLEMSRELGATAAQASLALAAFWGMVTAGRLLFAAIERWLPGRVAYRLLPLVVAGAFVLTGVLPHGAALAGVAVFGLAGLGCSALLPLTISFGEENMPAISAVVAGGLIACYQFGYGVAAFGVGPLQDAGLSLRAIFTATAVVALVMGAVSVAVARDRPPARPAQPGR